MMDRCASLPPKDDLQWARSVGASTSGPWCYFLKENLQNFGLGTTCVSSSDAATVLPLMRQDKGYVLQPHIARPALYWDDCTPDGRRQAHSNPPQHHFFQGDVQRIACACSGRKFHLRQYLLIAQRGAWAAEPRCSSAGARFYAHIPATKIVVSPNEWNAADTDTATQVTTARGKILFADFSGREAAMAAMMAVSAELVAVLQPKLLLPSAAKTHFELMGADYMLDEDGKAWLLEVNTGPVLHPKDVLDLELVGDILDTVVLGDGTAKGGWHELPYLLRRRDTSQNLPVCCGSIS